MRSFLKGRDILMQCATLVVLLSWATELHPNWSLTPYPQREREKIEEKGSRVELRTGRSPKSYNYRQNRLSIGGFM